MAVSRRNFGFGIGTTNSTLRCGDHSNCSAEAHGGAEQPATAIAIATNVSTGRFGDVFFIGTLLPPVYDAFGRAFLQSSGLQKRPVVCHLLADLLLHIHERNVDLTLHGEVGERLPLFGLLDLFDRNGQRVDDRLRRPALTMMPRQIDATTS